MRLQCNLCITRALEARDCRFKSGQPHTGCLTDRLAEFLTQELEETPRTEVNKMGIENIVSAINDISNLVTGSKYKIVKDNDEKIYTYIGTCNNLKGDKRVVFCSKPAGKGGISKGCEFFVKTTMMDLFKDNGWTLQAV